MEAKRISHSLRRKYLLKQFTEGMVERKRWRGRRRKQLLDGLKEEDILEFETRKHYISLTGRTRFGGGYGLVARQSK